MSISLAYNSYNILGLSSDAEQKIILKRSKEISNQLKIGIVPEYSIDIPICLAIRSDQNIKQAVHKLQSPKSRIHEYFFWFTISDETDSTAITFIRESKYNNAIDLWRQKILLGNTDPFTHKKNLAILYYLLLLNANNKDYIQDSVNLWKELIHSDTFWTNLFRAYEQINGQSTENDIYNVFKSEALDTISAMYAELSSVHNEPIYVSAFYNAFSHKSDYLENNVLNPIYEVVNNCIEKLKAIEISSNEDFNENVKNNLKSLIILVQTNLNSLKEHGLYDDSASVVIRDNLASAIRSISVDLYNHTEHDDKSESLLKIAINLAATSSQIETLEQDLARMEKLNNDDITKDPIKKLIELEDFVEAITRIEAEIPIHADNEDLQEFFRYQLRDAVSLFALNRMKIARKALDDKAYERSKLLYKEIGDFIYKYLDFFDFNKSAIDSLIENIYHKVANYTSIDEVDAYREQYSKISEEKFKDTIEEYVLMMIFDAHCNSALSNKVLQVRSGRSVENLLSYAGQIAVFIFVAWLISLFKG